MRRGDLAARDPNRLVSNEEVGAALAELAEVVAELRSGDATHGGLRLAATVHIMSEGRPTDFPVRLWAASLRRHNVSLHYSLANLLTTAYYLPLLTYHFSPTTSHLPPLTYHHYLLGEPCAALTLT